MRSLERSPPIRAFLSSYAGRGLAGLRAQEGFPWGWAIFPGCQPLFAEWHLLLTPYVSSLEGQHQTGAR